MVWSKIRGSQLPKLDNLLGIKGLGLTGESYIFEKATEVSFGADEEESFVSYDMQRGTELEPIAFKQLRSWKIGRGFKKLFFRLRRSCRASPSLVGNDAILEMSQTHEVLSSLKTIKSDKVYMSQMQMQNVVY
jgi:hypothetical protein